MLEAKREMASERIKKETDSAAAARAAAIARVVRRGYTGGYTMGKHSGGGGGGGEGRGRARAWGKGVDGVESRGESDGMDLRDGCSASCVRVNTRVCTAFGSRVFFFLVILIG